MPYFVHKKNRFTSFQIIILGFAAVILIGALLLMLPVSSKAGVMTPFNEALFTSTSAVVMVWTGHYTNPHSDRRTWCYYGCGIICILDISFNNGTGMISVKESRGKPVNGALI